MTRKILFFFLLLATTPQLALAQAPGNDCASAVPITLAPGTAVSTGQQSNIGLTNDYALIGCGVGNAIFVGGIDGVYSIDVVLGGTYTFEFANYGTVWKSLRVYNSCPLTACVPNGILTGGTNNEGTSTAVLTPGTYYLVVDSPAGTFQPAVFELLITTPISNSDCSGAVELFSTVDCSFVTYTNEGATNSTGEPLPTCGNYQGGDVWFTYEVDSGGEFTITTEANVMTDSGMSVYSGTCGSLTQLDCNNDFFGFASMSSITLTGRPPGEIIYVRLWEYGNDNNGTFEICVTTPLPPGNNGVYSDCPNERGLELTSDYTCPAGVNAAAVVFGNLESAPTAFKPNGIPVNSAVCNFSTSLRRYEEINFTVPTNGVYVFEMTAASGFDGMGYIVQQGFTPGVCGAGFVRVDDDSGPGNLPQLTVTLTAATPYTLVTTEYFSGGSGNSPYTWTITSGQNVNWTTVIPIDWYTVAVGGSPITTGAGFSPVNFPGSGLTDTSIPGIYPYWFACSTAPTIRTRVDYVIGKHWNGTTNDWNTPSNWSGNSVPTDSQCIYIPAGTPNDPIIADDDNGDGFNLNIETGASLTLTSNINDDLTGSTLTIQDYIAIQGTGLLTVGDDASLIQVNDTPSAPNSGDIVLNRNASIRLLDYVYYSSPVQGFDVSNVYGGFTPTHIYEWEPTTATGFLSMPGNVPIIVGNWNNLNSGVMDLGKGYAVRGPSNHTATLSTATSVFTGVPNNGVITQAISSGNYSGGGLLYNPYGTDNLSATQLDDNWNLIGNPYPSALDADAFLMLPSNNIIEGAVHIWTHGTAIGNNGDSFYDDFVYTYSAADYITYNISGSSYPNETFLGNIASGQGFFVLALADNESGNVTFNNSMRGRTHSNTEFYRTSSGNENVSNTDTIERHRIWLDLINQNGASSNILVGYIEGATQEKDRLFDAFTREVNSLSIYSKIGDERMIIQGRSLPFDENDQVPLGTVIPQAGEYTIAISNVDGLFLDDSQNIYLEDTQTGVIHNLRAAPYSFTESEAIDYEDRFILRYTDDALSINELELNALSIIAPKGEYIKINSDSSPIDAVIVYDLLGRVIFDKNTINQSEFVLNNHNFSSGTYIVKATLANGKSKAQKIVLKR
ncbi:T9SS sorting signal type C domain-containing protein [Psychroserpens jangbogonensis]|uniref:T9SS sorting signal type C domain-containing protein n=1 Tax=Psychroserpens jangbogonensis TaxID=1484460 RepID=UPI00053D755C|nr:T9SS sorting signal type C domain-containing protein [Psychroserpens jangbogonensis]